MLGPLPAARVTERTYTRSARRRSGVLPSQGRRPDRKRGAMEEFSDYLCAVCGDPIGDESYFATFGRKPERLVEELWPESVAHRRCMTRNDADA